MDWLYCTLVVLVSAAVLAMWDVPRRVTGLVWLSFMAHAVASAAQVMVTLWYYGGGDMVGYYELGRAYAELIRLDPGTYLGDVARYTLQQPAPLPDAWAYEGTPTASMTGLATFIMLVSGDSIWSACCVVAMASFFAKLAICRVVWRRVDVAHHRRVAIAVLLLPSAVFWTSGLIKEGVAMCGMGAVLAGAFALYERRMVAAIVGIAVGVLLAGLVKPYVLVPLACAMAVWAYFVHMQRGDPTRAVPVRLSVALVALALALGVVLALGQLFPAFSVDRVAEQAAQYQDVGGAARGGSTYEFGDGNARGVGGQLAYVPFALMSVLFRPLLIEARGPVLAANAIEATVLLVLLIGGLYRRRLSGMVASVMSSPELAFCAVMTVVLGVGVGLTTTNLGTLSRYRAPLMPFYALLASTLWARPTALSGRRARVTGGSERAAHLVGGGAVSLGAARTERLEPRA